MPAKIIDAVYRRVSLQLTTTETNMSNYKMIEEFFYVYVKKDIEYIL